MRRMHAIVIILGVSALGPGCSELSFNHRSARSECGQLFFAAEPGSGRCVPILACGPDSVGTEAWADCENPCSGLEEKSCAGDSRCQVVMSTTQTGLSYLGCNVVEEQRSCEALDRDGCAANPTCEPVQTFCSCFTDLVSQPPGSDPVPLECKLENCMSEGGVGVCKTRSCFGLGPYECSRRADCLSDGSSCTPADVTPCAGLNEFECLERNDCNAVASDCFCTPYMDCKCTGGAFVRCEPGAVTPGLCATDNDCPSSFVCQTFADGSKCVPAGGCAALDEMACSQEPSCAAKFREVCVPPPGVPVGSTDPSSPYPGGGTGGGGGSADGGIPQPFFSGDGGSFAGSFGGSAPCVPAEVFAGCQDLEPGQIVPDRSVMIDDPEVLDEPRYRFEAMFARLSPGVDATPMWNRLLDTLTRDTTITTRVAFARPGAATFFANLPRRADGLIPPAAMRLRPVAIMNRIDLVSLNSCGEARIVYASDFGIHDAAKRMTVIFEFGVPSDGAGCRTVARRWVDLSKLSPSDPAFAQAVGALTDELFQAGRLNQLRTNEFLNGNLMTKEWELREFKLVGGELVPAPCADSPDPSLANSAGFLDWVRANQSSILLQIADVPATLLAPSSIATEQHRVQLPVDLKPLEKALNTQTCGGCHATETGTLFVHLGERRFSNVRSTPSPFLVKDLARRTELLQTLLGDSPTAKMLRTRLRPDRVH